METTKPSKFERMTGILSMFCILRPTRRLAETRWSLPAKPCWAHQPISQKPMATRSPTTSICRPRKEDGSAIQRHTSRTERPIRKPIIIDKTHRCAFAPDLAVPIENDDTIFSLGPVAAGLVNRAITLADTNLGNSWLHPAIKAGARQFVRVLDPERAIARDRYEPGIENGVFKPLVPVRIGEFPNLRVVSTFGALEQNRADDACLRSAQNRARVAKAFRALPIGRRELDPVRVKRFALGRLRDCVWRRDKRQRRCKHDVPRRFQITHTANDCRPPTRGQLWQPQRQTVKTPRARLLERHPVKTAKFVDDSTA